MKPYKLQIPTEKIQTEVGRHTIIGVSEMRKALDRFKTLARQVAMLPRPRDDRQ